MDQTQTLNSILLLVTLLLARRRRRQGEEINRREVWVNRVYLRRDGYGFYHSLLPDLINNNQVTTRDLFRLDHDVFVRLCNQLRPTLEKFSPFRTPLSPEEKIAIALKFFAHGECYSSLSFVSRVAKPTLSKIIPEVCLAIIDNLGSEYMAIPNTEAAWRSIARRFDDRWQFPNCLGAVDGKHVSIKCPPGTGSEYRNYKGFFSIVLLGRPKQLFEL